jgi:hypothetical protein
MTGNHINDAAWHKKWGNSSGSPLQVAIMVFFYCIDSANAGSHRNTNAISVFLIND